MKIAIIGGGASGLACAIEAMREAKKLGKKISVTVFESNDRVGKKLLATGNGRCNMTNLDTSLSTYFGKYAFYRSALEQYPPQSNIEFFNSLGLYTKADSEGRVYPLSNQAASVLDVLRLECERLGIIFLCGETVKKIAKSQNAYKINDVKIYDKVVLACGGKAAVKQHNGYELLTSLGHSVTKTFPSLVKLTTSNPVAKQLKGIRAAVKMTLISDGKPVAEESGELLFGDGVLSGIASMQLSAFAARCNEKLTVRVNFIPSMNYSELTDAIEHIHKNAGETKAENLLLGFMPKKIGMVIIKNAGISPERKISTLTAADIKAIAAMCKKFDFDISGTKGFADAQVTAGGANTDEFRNKTMESKKCKGLYCCGELLDVDALCGGYNLQWAWSSGRLCGKSIVSGE
ncbi:MAG: NAD(P)/FAD-dependent oxidoreductase [Faecalibacterium sp.]|nr:NAD(P)/FAD-dependent oxidoreductase [Ruminococcus sp.]MCM1393197.1 NAD(P)/FAD-dependent oxidoreductase [Ruminococcus sp.]MCM1486647.1 NAD(P)/FAD-dependent oxidoreductase [Faecalibacterium sp.]